MEDDKLRSILEKCIAAKGYARSPHSVPDGVNFKESRCGDCWCICKEVHHQYDEPIRLADVLLTVRDKNKGTGAGEVLIAGGETLQVLSYWNLRADDLEQQSPETIEFMAKLLQ